MCRPRSTEKLVKVNNQVIVAALLGFEQKFSTELLNRNQLTNIIPNNND